MKRCKNGAIRQDYCVYRRSDDEKVGGPYFATSAAQAVGYYVKINGIEPEFYKYHALPVAPRESRPAESLSVPACHTAAPRPRQLDLDLSGEVDF